MPVVGPLYRVNISVLDIRIWAHWILRPVLGLTLSIPTLTEMGRYRFILLFL